MPFQSWEARPGDDIDLSMPVDRDAPVNQGLVGLWSPFGPYGNGAGLMPNLVRPSSLTGTATVNGIDYSGGYSIGTGCWPGGDVSGYQGLQWPALHFYPYLSQTGRLYNLTLPTAGTFSMMVRQNETITGDLRMLAGCRTDANGTQLFDFFQFSASNNSAVVGWLNGLLAKPDRRYNINGLIPVGLWQHLVVAWNSNGDCAAYADGAPLSLTARDATATANPWWDTGDGRNGCVPYVAYNQYPGQSTFNSQSVAGITLHDRVLSADEVVALSDEAHRCYPTTFRRVGTTTYFTGVTVPTPTAALPRPDADIDLSCPLELNNGLSDYLSAFLGGLPGVDGGPQLADLLAVSAGRSGQGYYSTVVGSPAVVTGPSGVSALVLDGSSKYATGPTTPLLVAGDKSVFAMIRPTTGTGVRGIIDQEFSVDSTTYGGWGLWLDFSTGKLWWWTHPNKDLISTGATVAFDTWSFVGVVWAGTTAKFYVNGVLNSTVSDGTIVEKTVSGTPLNVGNLRNNLSSGTYAFLGQIAECLTYGRAFTGEEAASLSQEAFGKYQNWFRRLRVAVPVSAATPPPTATLDVPASGDIDLSCPLNLAHPSTDSLVAFWLGVPGTAGGTQIADVFGLSAGRAAYHGTLANGATWTGTERFGGVLLANADDNCVTTGVTDNTVFGPASGVPLSGLCVCTPTTTTPSSAAPLFSKRNVGGGWGLYLLTTGALRLVQEKSDGGNGVQLDTATGVLTANQLNVVGFCLAVNGPCAIWVNGVAVATTTPTAYTPYASTDALFLGGEPSTPRAFPGVIEAWVLWRGRIVDSDEQVALTREVKAGYPNWLNRVRVAVPLSVAPVSPSSSTYTTDTTDTADIDLSGPLNLSHPYFLPGRLSSDAHKIWAGVPGLTGGSLVPDLLKFHGVASQDLTFNTGCTWGAGPDGTGLGAMVLDGGSNSWAVNTDSVPAAYNSATATVWAMVKFDTAPGAGAWGRICGLCDGDGGGVHDKELFITASGGAYYLAGYVYDTDAANIKFCDGTGVAAAQIPIGEWVTVALTVNGTGGTMALYVNGVLAATTACGNTYAGYSANNMLLGGKNVWNGSAGSSFYDNRRVAFRCAAWGLRQTAMDTNEVLELDRELKRGLPTLLRRVPVNRTASDGGSTPTAGSAADTGTGTDAGSLTVALAGADTGTGVDAAALSSPRSDTDTAVGTEAGSLAAALSTADTAAGTEAVSLTVALPATDAAAATEAGTLATALDGTDTATGEDAGSVAGTAVGADTAVGVDGAALTAAVPASDTAAGVESVGLAAALPATDSATGEDAGSVSGSSAPTGTDTATGDEAGSLVVTLAATDTALGEESAALVAALAAADTATGVDGGDVAGVSTPSGGDTATGDETGSLVVTLAATDAATVTDSGAIALAPPSGETGTAADAGGLVAAVTLADTGVAVEAWSIVVTLPGTDAGAGTDDGTADNGTLVGDTNLYSFMAF